MSSGGAEGAHTPLAPGHAGILRLGVELHIDRGVVWMGAQCEQPHSPQLPPGASPNCCHTFSK